MMMTLIVSLGTILFGFIWAARTKKPLTQRITVLLSAAALLQYDTLIGLAPFSFYVITFASVLAGVEPGNSLNLKPYQKTFFLLTSFVFVLFTLEMVLSLPFTINRSYFGMAYIIVAFIVWFLGGKKVKTRLGYMVVWFGIAFDWVF